MLLLYYPYKFRGRRGKAPTHMHPVLGASFLPSGRSVPEFVSLKCSHATRDLHVRLGVFAFCALAKTPPIPRACLLFLLWQKRENTGHKELDFMRGACYKKRATVRELPLAGGLDDWFGLCGRRGNGGEMGGSANSSYRENGPSREGSLGLGTNDLPRRHSARAAGTSKPGYWQPRNFGDPLCP